MRVLSQRLADGGLHALEHHKLLRTLSIMRQRIENHKQMIDTYTNEMNLLIKCIPCPYIVEIDMHLSKPYHLVLRRYDVSLYNYVPKCSPDDVCLILKGVCEGLLFLHDQGYLHNDVKTTNVMLLLDKNNRNVVKPVLIDLNSSCTYAQSCFDCQLATQPIRHPSALFALDKYKDKRGFNAVPIIAPFGQEVDIWALGALLYTMLTHQTPFHSQDDNGGWSNRKLLVEQIRCLGALPEDMVDVIKDAEQRVIIQDLSTFHAPQHPVGIVRKVQPMIHPKFRRADFVEKLESLLDFMERAITFDLMTGLGAMEHLMALPCL